MLPSGFHLHFLGDRIAQTCVAEGRLKKCSVLKAEYIVALDKNGVLLGGEKGDNGYLVGHQQSISR